MVSQNSSKLPNDILTLFTVFGYMAFLGDRVCRRINFVINTHFRAPNFSSTKNWTFIVKTQIGWKDLWLSHKCTMHRENTRRFLLLTLSIVRSGMRDFEEKGPSNKWNKYSTYICHIELILIKRLLSFKDSFRTYSYNSCILVTYIFSNTL